MSGSDKVTTTHTYRIDECDGAKATTESEEKEGTGRGRCVQKTQRKT